MAVIDRFVLTVVAIFYTFYDIKLSTKTAFIENCRVEQYERCAHSQWLLSFVVSVYL